MSVATKPELLLPAGSPEKLQYAVAYGADAVYLGLAMASLRTPTRGEQFTPQNLGLWIDYCHQQGVKAYVTINIFANNRDLNRIATHLEHLESLRPDAIIVSDPGVYRLARQYAPSIPLHISTQANTLNVEACAFWQDLGVERVILAREVPVHEIAQIHEALPALQLECFVHGSLCVAYSGRCVISDYLSDNTKNSNKGMCGNSCRWEFEPETAAKGSLRDTEPLSLAMRESTRPNEVYTFEEDTHGSYMLNSKDLCLVHRLKALQEAGVCSFKVEGRTKSVFYVATAGRVYRQAIDAYQQVTEPSQEQIAQWVWELSQAGNRGFTEGFFTGRPDQLAYNYQDSKSQQGAEFVATVAGVSNPNGRVALKARNPFNQGECLDWMTPAGTVSLVMETLHDRNGLPVDAVQTNQQVWVKPPPGLDPRQLVWSVIRRSERVAVAR